MHLLAAGSKLQKEAGPHQCDPKVVDTEVTREPEGVDCPMCLWGALRIVRLTESALLMRMHALASAAARGGG